MLKSKIKSITSGELKVWAEGSLALELTMPTTLLHWPQQHVTYSTPKANTVLHKTHIKIMNFHYFSTIPKNSYQIFRYQEYFDP